jgi:splicing factor U2AF subunit
MDRDRERDRDRDYRERERDRHDQEQLMMNSSARPRSPSPARKREPTPDLTDVPSIMDRKRRLTQWDIKPPGYENVTAEQAKLSGMFPLPGAPRQQVVDPTRLQAFINQPTASASGTALRPTNSRQAKRLLAYNLPPSASEDALVAFFNLQLNGLNVVYGTDPCISAQFSRDRTFAVVEFKTSGDATLALAFDGITMEADDDAAAAGPNGGPPRGLELRRPTDYIIPAVVGAEMPYVPGVVSHMVVDSVHKISITNLPLTLGDDQMTELLVAFGELKAFVLVKDNTTDESRVSWDVLWWYWWWCRFCGAIIRSSWLSCLLSPLLTAAPPRASPFASTSTPPSPTLPSRASTAWTWRRTGCACARPARA